MPAGVVQAGTPLEIPNNCPDVPIPNLAGVFALEAYIISPVEDVNDFGMYCTSAVVPSVSSHICPSTAVDGIDACAEWTAL
jgi:hypothetical protein